MEEVKLMMLKRIAAAEKRLAHVPCIVSNSRRMAVWSDIKEVLFLWCANPQCSVVLTALKHQLGYPASEAAMHPCTQLEQLMFLKQYIIVSPGTLLVDLNAIRGCSDLMLLHDVVKMKHNFSKEPAVMLCREMMTTMSENYANTSIKIPLKTLTRKKFLPAVRRDSSAKPSNSVIKQEPNTSVKEEIEKVTITRNNSDNKNPVWVVKNKIKTEQKDFKNRGPVIDSVIYGVGDKGSSSALVPLALLRELFPVCQGFLEDTVRLYVLGRCEQEGLTGVGQCTLEESIQLTRFLACQNGYEKPWLCLTTCSVLMSWADFWYGYNKRKDCVKLGYQANDISVVTLSCQDLRDSLCKKKGSSPLKWDINTRQSSTNCTTDDAEHISEERPSEPIKPSNMDKLDNSIESVKSSTSNHSKTSRRKRKGKVLKSSSVDKNNTDTESIDYNHDKNTDAEQYVNKLRKKELPALKNTGNVRLTRSNVSASIVDNFSVDEVKDKSLKKKIAEIRSQDLSKKDRNKSTIKNKTSLKSKKDSNNSAVYEHYKGKADCEDKKSSASLSIQQESGTGNKAKTHEDVKIPCGEQSIDETDRATTEERVLENTTQALNDTIASKTDIVDDKPMNKTDEDINTDDETYNTVGIEVSITPKKKDVDGLGSTYNKKRAGDLTDRTVLNIPSATFIDNLPPKLRVKKNIAQMVTNTDTSVIPVTDHHLQEDILACVSEQTSRLPTTDTYKPKYVSVIPKQLQLNTPMINQVKPIVCGEHFPYKSVRPATEATQNNCSSAQPNNRPRSSEPSGDQNYPIIQGSPVFANVSKKLQTKEYISVCLPGPLHLVSPKVTPRDNTGKLPDEIVSNLKEQASKSICSILGNNDVKVIEQINAQGRVIRTVSTEDVADISEFESERVTMWRERVNPNHRASRCHGRLTKSADLTHRKERSYTYRPTSSIYSHTLDDGSYNTEGPSFKSALLAVYSRDKDSRVSSPIMKEPNSSEASTVSSVAESSKLTLSESSNKTEEFPNYGSSSSRTPDIYDEFARRRRPRVNLVKAEGQRLSRPGQVGHRSNTTSQREVSSNSIQYQRMKPVERRSPNHHTVGYTTAPMSQSMKDKIEKVTQNASTVQQRYCHALPRKFLNLPFTSSLPKFIQSIPDSPVKYPSCMVCRSSTNDTVTRHGSDTALTSANHDPIIHTSCAQRGTADVQQTNEVEHGTADNQVSPKLSSGSPTDSKKSMSLLQKMDSFLDNYVSPYSATEDTGNLKTFISGEAGSESSQKGSECIKEVCETNHYPFRHMKPDTKFGNKSVSTVDDDDSEIQTETGGQIARINSQLYYSVPGSVELVPVSAEVTIPHNAQFFVQTSAEESSKHITNVQDTAPSKEEPDLNIKPTNTNEHYEDAKSSEDDLISVDIKEKREDSLEDLNESKDDESAITNPNLVQDSTIEHLSEALSNLINNSEQELHSIPKTEKHNIVKQCTKTQSIPDECKHVKSTDSKDKGDITVGDPEEVESFRYIIPSPVKAKSKTKPEKNFQEFVEESRAAKRKHEDELRKKKFWASAQVQYLKYCQSKNADKVSKKPIKQKSQSKYATKTNKNETNTKEIKSNNTTINERRPKSTASLREKPTQQLKPRPKTGSFQKQTLKAVEVKDNNKVSPIKNDVSKRVKSSDKQASTSNGRGPYRPKTSQSEGEKKRMNSSRLSKSAKQAIEIPNICKEREHRGKAACEDTFQVVTALRRLSIEGTFGIANRKVEARRNRLRSFVKEEIDKHRLDEPQLSPRKIVISDQRYNDNNQSELQANCEPNIDLHGGLGQELHNSASDRNNELSIGDNQVQDCKVQYLNETDHRPYDQSTEDIQDFKQTAVMPYKKVFITQSNPNNVTHDSIRDVDDHEATCNFSEVELIKRQIHELKSADTDCVSTVRCNLNSNDNNRHISDSTLEPMRNTLSGTPSRLQCQSVKECSSNIQNKCMENEAASLESSVLYEFPYDDQKNCINYVYDYHYPEVYDPRLYDSSNTQHNVSQTNTEYDTTDGVFETDEAPYQFDCIQTYNSNVLPGYSDNIDNCEDMYLRVTGPDGAVYHVARDDPNFIPLINYFSTQKYDETFPNNVEYDQTINQDNCYDQSDNIEDLSERMQRDIETQQLYRIEEKQINKTDYSNDGQCEGYIDSLSYQNVIYGNGVKQLEWQPSVTNEHQPIYHTIQNDYCNRMDDYRSTDISYLPVEQIQNNYPADEGLNQIPTDSVSHSVSPYIAGEFHNEQTDQSQPVYEDHPIVYIDRDEVEFFTDHVDSANEVTVCTENQEESQEDSSGNLPISSTSTVPASSCNVNSDRQKSLMENNTNNQVESKDSHKSHYSLINSQSVELLGIPFSSSDTPSCTDKTLKAGRQVKTVKVKKKSKVNRTNETATQKKKDHTEKKSVNNKDKSKELTAKSSLTDQVKSSDDISSIPSSSTIGYDCDDEYEIDPDDELHDRDYIPDISDTSSYISDGHEGDIGDIYEDVRKINESLGKSSQQKSRVKKNNQGKPGNSLNKLRKDFQKKYDVKNSSTLKLNEKNKHKSSKVKIVSTKQKQVDNISSSEFLACENKTKLVKACRKKPNIDKQKCEQKHECSEKQKETGQCDDKSDSDYLVTDRLSYYEMKQYKSNRRKKLKHRQSKNRASVNEEDSDEEKKQIEEAKAAEGFIKTQQMYFDILKNQSSSSTISEVKAEISDAIPSEPAEVPTGIPLHGDRVITKAIADAEKALEGTGSLSEHEEEEPQVIEDRINQCSYQLVDDEDHINLGGLAYYLHFVLPFVFINGYKYVPLKDIQTMFQPDYCVSNCTIPRSVLSKHKNLIKSFSTWEQVYKFELIKMKKGPTITTGDVVIKLDSLLNFLPDVISEIVKLHHNTKLKRSKNCNIARYKRFPLGQKNK